MSPNRQPINPPELAGYSYLERLGAGGFADVFLYERQFPRQQVAIKVLDRYVSGDSGHDRFTAEANTMASLSTHPFIVTIFHAEVSAEGHPYLVMEYYPGANYSVRSKSERFSVADVLRLGVQVASAVETAHRAGILHRDIKPANILTSAYGRPGLTDFGIAASLDAVGPAAEGLSIPWSPPEAFAGFSATDERSDVYSLAATLYTILEGRSPFERPGETVRTIELIDRIERENVPPFERKDTPTSLHRLLSQAMAKDRANRPASAADLARTLQAIEIEQRFDLTPLEVTKDTKAPTEAIDADAGSTNIKSPTVVQGQSRFSAPSDTVTSAKGSGWAGGDGSSAPIRGVPFAIPDPPAPTKAAPGHTFGQTDFLPTTASSATYQQPAVSQSLPPSPPAGKGSVPKNYLVAGIVTLTVVILAIVVVLLLSQGQKGGTVAVAKPQIAGWWSVSNDGGRVVWRSTDNQTGDKYTVVYQGHKLTYPGSTQCGQQQAASAFYCSVSPATPPFGPITVYRIRNHQQSAPATSPYTGPLSTTTTTTTRP